MRSSESVKQLFGFLQADASNVYDILDRGPPTDNDDGVSLVGCFAHLRGYFFEAANCRYPVGLQSSMRIRAICAADEAARHAPTANRHTLREQHVRPLMTSLFNWLAARVTARLGAISRPSAWARPEPGSRALWPAATGSWQ